MLSLRGAVGENQRCLAAAAGSTAPLRVVRWRGGNVPQVHSVECCDVDAEFHRRRTEQNRQESVGLPDLANMLLISRELFLLLVPIAETFFANCSLLSVNLSSMFTSLKPEQRMDWVTKHPSEIPIEIPKKRAFIRMCGIDFRRALAE